MFKIVNSDSGKPDTYDWHSNRYPVFSIWKIIGDHMLWNIECSTVVQTCRKIRDDNANRVKLDFISTTKLRVLILNRFCEDRSATVVWQVHKYAYPFDKCASYTAAKAYIRCVCPEFVYATPISITRVSLNEIHSLRCNDESCHYAVSYTEKKNIIGSTRLYLDE